MCINNLEELKQKRFQFIHLLYGKSGGDKFYTTNMYDLGKELCFGKKETEIIAQYLEDEGLIGERTMGGFLSITHCGITEVEEALSEPDEATEHFPAFVNIINVNQMIGSQIQQGTIGSTQSGVFSIENKKELSDFIELLKGKLPDLSLDENENSEINADISSIEAQMSSNRPKKGIIEESLTSIKRILEGATGGVIAEQLLKYIPALLSAL